MYIIFIYFIIYLGKMDKEQIKAEIWEFEAKNGRVAYKKGDKWITFNDLSKQEIELLKKKNALKRQFDALQGKNGRN